MAAAQLVGRLLGLALGDLATLMTLLPPCLARCAVLAFFGGRLAPAAAVASALWLVDREEAGGRGAARVESIRVGRV